MCQKGGEEEARKPCPPPIGVIAHRCSVCLGSSSLSFPSLLPAKNVNCAPWRAPEGTGPPRSTGERARPAAGARARPLRSARRRASWPFSFFLSFFFGENELDAHSLEKREERKRKGGARVSIPPLRSFSSTRSSPLSCFTWPWAA